MESALFRHVVQTIDAGGGIVCMEAKLMAAIGHELHHAIEILSDPAVAAYRQHIPPRSKPRRRLQPGTLSPGLICRFQQGGDRWSSRIFHGELC
jgi:hypothetical protein